MNKIFTGDSLKILKTLESETVQTCVTSPPYFGLRDYGMKGQIGLEETPDAYVAKMVELFHEVYRVLKNDGTLWLNLGDSYGRFKQLIGIPWRVAFALQADGWYLRQDIIWHKPNPMPESVTDRCTKAHEYIFLLSKSSSYYYDHEAVKEPLAEATLQDLARRKNPGSHNGLTRQFGKMAGLGAGPRVNGDTRNRRSVWTVSTKPYKGAHFATFPPALIEPCILAGAPEMQVVLDPFFGSGTTGAVAKKLGRQFIGIELNSEYVKLAKARLADTLPPQPMLIAAE